MNRFYIIASEGEEPENEFIIKNFGDKVPQNKVYMATQGYIDIRKDYIPAKPKDYDLKFIAHLRTLSPVYKTFEFLDFHFEKYNSDKQEFLKQIKYSVLPLLSNNKTYTNIINEWLEMKEPKKTTESTNYTIKTGDINAPVQFQQSVNHSNQTQSFDYSAEQIQDFFKILKSDIVNLEEAKQEEFNTEIEYATRQLNKGKDISSQLTEIGSLIQNTGISFFVNLASSGVFEVIKPYLGL
ncbi:hypothetical protein [Flavobacterium lacisediminis]|uniref:Uncharacterized protein n=1 Tax=Flavobacterium lacisediminis TaxID=2989705 RepID=A0ABT3EKP1_9FLAO|nr:hypothetical protein [Flavobacterium lacisediminis]MCW1149128.1 hypothetical protein [Flavobacterium lacisediminis]